MTPPLIPAILALVNLDKPISLPPIGTYLSPVWERVKGLFADKPVTPLPRDDAYQAYIDSLLDRPKPPLTPRSPFTITGAPVGPFALSGSMSWASGCVAVTGAQSVYLSDSTPATKRKRRSPNPTP